jgi:hypothetical protein
LRTLELFALDTIARGLADRAAPDLDPLGPARVIGEGFEGVVDARLFAGLLRHVTGEVALVEAVAFQGTEAEGVDPGVDRRGVVGVRNRSAPTCK